MFVVCNKLLELTETHAGLRINGGGGGGGADGLEGPFILDCDFDNPPDRGGFPVVRP